MKKLRIGRRRGRGNGLDLSPLELALYPALSSGRWDVPDRFNFARDVVEGLAEDPKRRAVTFIGKDGIIEPRAFHVVAEHAARWSWLLRERGVRHGDPVLVLTGTHVDWLELSLACMKVGAIVVPGSPTLSAETLDVLLERTGAEVVLADRAVESELSRTTNRPLALYVDEAKELLASAPEQAPTHDSSARDIAFILTTPGTAGAPRLVGHSHGAVFAARVAAEHWLDAGRGDAVLCTAEPGSAESVWHTLVGPWSRGAELLLHDGAFEPLERLDLIYRLGATVLCQTPAEYATLSQLRELERFRPPQLRRLVSTGEYLDPAVSEIFENVWGLTIHDGYGQAETNIVVANGADAGYKAGSLGVPLPGHQVAVVDEQGNELPPDVEGEIAVRGRPPTLFAGYWESPEQTKQAFRGDWYATGDLATVDRDGFFWFVARASDVILSRGERFGPYEAERALRTHEGVADSAVVGVRDLERGGQFVRAFVVLAPGVEGSDQLEAELRHAVGSLLPEHEVPREIEFVDELPTTPGRKLRRLELRERLVVGRPLWEKPAAKDEVEEDDPWAGMLDPLPADRAAATEAEAPTGRLPDYIVEPTAESARAPEIEAPLEASAPAIDELPDYVVEPTPVVEEHVEPATELVDEAPEREPEPSHEPALEAAPAEPEPEPEPELEEPEPEQVAAVAPLVEAEPAPAPELETPAGEVLPGPSPVPQPPQIPVPDPEPPTEPDPERAPDPDLVPEPEPQPEPPDTGPVPDTGPIALLEPEEEDASEDESQPVHQPEFGLAALTEPEVEPVAESSWTPVLDPPPPPEPEPEPEPDPEPAPDPDPEPDPAAAAEPAGLPDYVVEPTADDEAPPATPQTVSESASEQDEPLTAESILNPKPPPGPLPDFIVDPDLPVDDPLPPLRVAGSSPPPPSDSSTDDIPRASLGLPPLSDFPSLPSLPLEGGSEETDEASEPKRGRSGRRRAKDSAPPKSKKGRRERSAGEPGDMQESMDWAGLSNRLSAYSLSQRQRDDEPNGGEPEPEPEPEPELESEEDT